MGERKCEGVTNKRAAELLSDVTVLDDPEMSEAHELAISALYQQDLICRITNLPCSACKPGPCDSRKELVTDRHQMTNEDRIRAMSDKELARFLASVENRRSADGGGAQWCGMAHALKWLQQPAEEVAHD